MVLAPLPRHLTPRQLRYRERRRRMKVRQIKEEVMGSVPSIRRMRRKAVGARVNWMRRVANTGFVDRRYRRPLPFQGAEEETEEVVGILGFRRRSRFLVGANGPNGFRIRVDRRMDFSVFTTDRRWMMDLIARVASYNYLHRNPGQAGTIIGGVAGPIEDSLGEIFSLILEDMGLTERHFGVATNLHDMRRYV